jgi:hypothetical protein
LDGPTTIAGDKTKAIHIAEFGIGTLGANGIVATAFDAVRARAQIPGQGAKAMPSQSEVIETTVSAVAAELERRGPRSGSCAADPAAILRLAQ